MYCPPDPLAESAPLHTPDAPCTCRVHHRCRLGHAGEDQALAHLKRRGFCLIDRNYRTRGGEIDLIVSDPKLLLFVEVKTRLARSPGPTMKSNSLQWLSARQQTRQRRLALAWLHDEHRPRVPPRDIRFDAIGVLLDSRERLIDLEHLEGLE